MSVIGIFTLLRNFLKKNAETHSLRKRAKMTITKHVSGAGRRTQRSTGIGNAGG